MSYPPNALGDQGQRYLVETFNWPEENQWNNFSYCNKIATGIGAMDLIAKHPCVTATRITDRKPEP